MTNETNQALTPASAELLCEYADDAGNWSGMPLVGGNVGGTKEDRGNLTDLKVKGFIHTFEDIDDDGTSWVVFEQLAVDWLNANHPREGGWGWLIN